MFERDASSNFDQVICTREIVGIYFIIFTVGRRGDTIPVYQSGESYLRTYFGGLQSDLQTSFVSTKIALET